MCRRDVGPRLVLALPPCLLIPLVLSFLSLLPPSRPQHTLVCTANFLPTILAFQASALPLHDTYTREHNNVRHQYHSPMQGRDDVHARELYMGPS